MHLNWLGRRFAIAFSVVSAIASATLGAARASAQGELGLNDRINRWFLAEWKAAAEIPDLSPCLVRWVQEQWWFPPDAELAALRQAVRDHPDHPQRDLLPAYEQRRAGTPTQIRQVLFGAGPNRWRVCRDFAAAFYSDITVTNNYGWEMTDRQFEVMPPGSAAFEQRASAPNSFWYQLSFNIDGGLSTVRRSGDYALSSPVVHGARWSIRASSVGGGPATIWEFAGRWDESLDRGFVERVTIAASQSGPSWVGYRHDVLDWALSSELDRWVAGRVEWRKPSGQLDEVIRIDRIERLDERTFEKSLAVPEPGGVDIVRGPTTFATVVDHRRGVAVTRTADGAVASAPVGDAGRTGFESAWSRWMGWTAAGLLAAGLACLAIHKRITTRPA